MKTHTQSEDSQTLPTPRTRNWALTLPSEGDAEEKWESLVLLSGEQGGIARTIPAASPEVPASLSRSREPAGQAPRASCVCWSPSKDGHSCWQRYETGDQQMALSEARVGGEAGLAPVSQLSRSGVSNSLRPHGLQHTRPPYPSPTPAVYSNSCSLSQ